MIFHTNGFACALQEYAHLIGFTKKIHTHSNILLSEELIFLPSEIPHMANTGSTGE